MSPKVQTELAEALRRGSSHSLIVTVDAPEVAESFDHLGAAVHQRWPAISAVALSANAFVIGELAARDDVVRIELDGEMQASTVG